LAFTLQFTPDCEEHLRNLTADEKARVLDAIAQQLVHQPNVATRNRKAMRADKLATWELRIGPLRVYYDVQELPDPVVTIVAVGIKQRNRVFIQNKEVEL
jgi:mRNA-degrading endonuclease RelE of RelBE toxin-antitoxin system